MFRGPASQIVCDPDVFELTRRGYRAINKVRACRTDYRGSLRNDGQQNYASGKEMRMLQRFVRVIYLRRRIVEQVVRACAASAAPAVWLRAYPNRPQARHVMRASARWSMAT